ncbi:MAG UNVERIFIED_CONTAM: hypothetical protein LVR18_06420 [Planctomycetaceae bacterium]
MKLDSWFAGRTSGPRYSYRWNEQGTDAELISREGLDADFSLTDATTGVAKTQTWHYPSRAECMVCHSRPRITSWDCANHR